MTKRALRGAARWQKEVTQARYAPVAVAFLIVAEEAVGRQLSITRKPRRQAFNRAIKRVVRRVRLP